MNMIDGTKAVLPLAIRERCLSARERAARRTSPGKVSGLLRIARVHVKIPYSLLQCSGQVSCDAHQMWYACAMHNWKLVLRLKRLAVHTIATEAQVNHA